MGEQCRGIDHLGLAVVVEDRIHVACLSCDARVELPRSAMDPRSISRMPISFQAAQHRHVHENFPIEVAGFFGGEINQCRHCNRALVSHAFGGGPGVEGVVWRPSRCHAGHHEFSVDFALGVRLEDPAECRNCGEVSTVENALGY